MSRYNPNAYQTPPAPPSPHRSRCCDSSGACISCGQKKRPGFIGRTFSRVLHLLLLFALLVFVGGTLKSTGQPGAQRFGEALHTVTFTEEIQDWSFREGHGAVFASVNFLSRGVDLSRWVHPEYGRLTSR